MYIIESLCQTSFGKFRIKVDNNINVGGKRVITKNRRITFSKYNRLEPFIWSLE